MLGGIGVRQWGDSAGEGRKTSVPPFQRVLSEGCSVQGQSQSAPCLAGRAAGQGRGSGRTGVLAGSGWGQSESVPAGRGRGWRRVRTGLRRLCRSQKVSLTLLFQASLCSHCNRSLPSPGSFCSSVFIVPWSLNRLDEVWVQEGVLGISSEKQPLERT